MRRIFNFSCEIQMFVLNLYSLSPVELARKKDIWFRAIFTCEMFFTSSKFGMIGSLCIRLSEDKNSRKHSRWRLRCTVKSDLLLHVEKLHDAWLGWACNISFSIYSTDRLFWRSQTVFSRRVSKVLPILCISKAMEWLLFTALWAVGMPVVVTMGCHVWQRYTQLSIASGLHTSCQTHHSTVPDHSAFLTGKGGRDTSTSSLV